ncbi:hypothetical protein M3J09_002520 [Ascochyta lentis]
MASSQDAITLHNQTQSPLLRLPVEIRYMIWEHILGDKDFSLWTIDGKFLLTFRKPETNFWAGTKIRHHFALTRVCRQTHAETRFLPFLLNAISTTPPCLSVWLKRFNQAQLSCIRTVTIYQCQLSFGQDVIHPHVRNALWAMRELTGLRKIHLHRDNKTYMGEDSSAQHKVALGAAVRSMVGQFERGHLIDIKITDEFVMVHGMWVYQL